MIDIEANIKSGVYENLLPYPERGGDKANRERFSEARAVWNKETNRINKIFRDDLATAFELTGHPKEEKVWNMAWEEGHSEGLYMVYQYYDDLADLVKP